jgi:hypothetical protein
VHCCRWRCRRLEGLSLSAWPSALVCRRRDQPSQRAPRPRLCWSRAKRPALHGTLARSRLGAHAGLPPCSLALTLSTRAKGNLDCGLAGSWVCAQPERPQISPPPVSRHSDLQHSYSAATAPASSTHPSLALNAAASSLLHRRVKAPLLQTRAGPSTHQQCLQLALRSTCQRRPLRTDSVESNWTRRRPPGRTAARRVRGSPVSVSPLSCGLPAVELQDSLQHRRRERLPSPHLQQTPGSVVRIALFASVR